MLILQQSRNKLLAESLIKRIHFNYLVKSRKLYQFYFKNVYVFEYFYVYFKDILEVLAKYHYIKRYIEGEYKTIGYIKVNRYV